MGTQLCREVHISVEGHNYVVRITIMLWETQLYSGRHNYIVGDTIMLWETQLCSGASQFNWHIAQECKN